MGFGNRLPMRVVWCAVRAGALNGPAPALLDRPPRCRVLTGPGLAGCGPRLSVWTRSPRYRSSRRCWPCGSGPTNTSFPRSTSPTFRSAPTQHPTASPALELDTPSAGPVRHEHLPARCPVCRGIQGEPERHGRPSSRVWSCERRGACASQCTSGQLAYVSRLSRLSLRL